MYICFTGPETVICRVYSVWVQLLDRPQQRLCVAVIPITHFVYEDTAATKSVPNSNIMIIVDEEVDTWINVTDILQVVHEENGRAWLLWASERTGTRQLYFVPFPEETYARVLFFLMSTIWKYRPQIFFSYSLVGMYCKRS